jgi:NAD(P)-dependent dehydrogenase (short-subunit alcohol dehydrogenase family)
LAIASRFLSEGAQVAVTGRDRERGLAVQEQLGGGALFVGADATDPEQVERSIAATVERFGQIDTLVNNAGIALAERLIDTPVEAFDALIAANLRGPYLYARGCFPALIKTRGSMIHIGSDAGLRAEQPIGAYCVSKAAVTMMSQVLALDGAEHGVRSNCVCPGATEPGMRHIGPAHDPDRGDDSSQWAPAPLGRIGTGSDVAGAVAYLASADAAFVSGAVLLIDGANGAGMFA